MRWVSVLIGLGVSALATYLVVEAVWPASRVQPMQTNAHFPEVTGNNLEGKRYFLPRDFEGERNLCLIAFTQEQQFDVNTWLEGLKPLEKTPGVVIYELPTLFKGTAAFRLWLDNVMYQGIPDKKQRERTITLYLDKVAFRKSLALPDENRIYALLVDRAGNVLWRTDGRFTTEKEAELRKVLALSAPNQ